MCRHTLYVWIGHEVEEGKEQGVGGGVSCSGVKVDEELFFCKRRPVAASLTRREETKKYYCKLVFNYILLL